MSGDAIPAAEEPPGDLVPRPRSHRGAHPADERLFADSQLQELQEAVCELSWLLSHGYAGRSALKLVGDRHALTERQRVAVGRAACSDTQREERQRRCVSLESVRRGVVDVDGFNLIITLEAALGGGVLLNCRDGCLRDMSSVHGSYRTVQETERAIQLIGEEMSEWGPGEVRWLLDQPISNSGRLAQMIRELAEEKGWPWTAELVLNPDPVLAQSEGVVVSADSAILDRCSRWLNLSQWLVAKLVPGARVVNLMDH